MSSNAVSSSDCTANGTMTDELERVLKEVAMALFEVLACHLVEGVGGMMLLASRLYSIKWQNNC
jgi:hypothetical protein